MPLLLVKIMWKLTWRWYTMCTACHNRDRHTHRGQYEVKHGVGSLFVKSDSPNNSVTVHWRYYEIHKHHHVRHRLTMYLYWLYPHKTLPSHNPFDTLYIIVMKGVSVYNYSDTPQGNSKLIANNNAHEPTCTPLPCIVNTCAFVLKWGWLFIPITNIL